jgi:hypothetical protein
VGPAPNLLNWPFGLSFLGVTCCMMRDRISLISWPCILRTPCRICRASLTAGHAKFHNMHPFLKKITQNSASERRSAKIRASPPHSVRPHVAVLPLNDTLDVVYVCLCWPSGSVDMSQTLHVICAFHSAALIYSSPGIKI